MAHSGRYFLVVCLWVAFGCTEKQSAPPDPSTDSQTHWMEPCQGEQECGDLSCICGVCTAACTSTCEGDARCVSADNAQCALGVAPAFCAPECDDNTPCASPLVCQAGVCLEQEEGICPDPGPVPECPPDRELEEVFDEVGCTIGYECNLVTCPPIAPEEGCPDGEALLEGEEDGCPFARCVSIDESFACGPTLFCARTGHYCNEVVPGVPEAETSYNCVNIQPNCEADVTCACIQPQTEGVDCTEGEGVTISTFLP